MAHSGGLGDLRPESFLKSPFAVERVPYQPVLNYHQTRAMKACVKHPPASCTEEQHDGGQCEEDPCVEAWTAPVATDVGYCAAFNALPATQERIALFFKKRKNLHLYCRFAALNSHEFVATNKFSKISTQVYTEEVLSSDGGILQFVEKKSNSSSTVLDGGHGKDFALTMILDAGFIFQPYRQGGRRIGFFLSLNSRYDFFSSRSSVVEVVPGRR